MQKEPRPGCGGSRGETKNREVLRGWLLGWRHFVRTGWATFRRARRSAGQLVSQVSTSTSVLHQVVEPGLRSGAAGFPGTQSLFLRPLRYSHVFLPISLLYGKQTLEFCVMFLGTGNGDSLYGFDVTNKSCTNILIEWALKTSTQTYRVCSKLIHLKEPAECCHKFPLQASQATKSCVQGLGREEREREGRCYKATSAPLLDTRVTWCQHERTQSCK